MDYMDYEKKFIRECRKLNIRLFKDIDGSPISKPRGKAAKIVKVASWSKDKCDISFVTSHKKTCVYGGGTGNCRCQKTKTSLITKFKNIMIPGKGPRGGKKKIKCELFNVGDLDARILFSISDLNYVAKNFGLFKKKMSKEQVEKASARIKKYWQQKKSKDRKD